MIKRSIITLAFGALVLVACQREAEPQKVGLKEITFTASIEGSTKATATAFEAGDQIGLSIGTPVNLANVMLTPSGEKLVPESTLYWPADLEQTTPVRFTAFYPYEFSTYTDVFDATKTWYFCIDQAQYKEGILTKQDYLSAVNDVAPADGSVDLRFKHLMSRFDLTIVNELGEDFSGEQGDSFRSVEINQLYTWFMINFGEQYAVANPDGGASFTCAPARTGTASYSLILPPQTVSPEIQISLKSGRKLSYSATSPIEFVLGKLVTATLTLTDDSISFNYQMEDWTDNPTEVNFVQERTTPENNEIWYTSTDNGAVQPYNVDAFGSDLISSTYVNGKGVLRFKEDVTTIGKYAFMNCQTLKTVKLPDTVEGVEDFAFWQCIQLEDITLPDGLTSIGNSAFNTCWSLSSISLPQSLSFLGTSAFMNCTSLTAVHIPESVTTIWQAFGGCSNLASFTGKYASEDGRCLISDNMMIGFAPAGLARYTVPANVTSIYNDVFRSCNELEEVILPEGLKKLYSSFYCCYNLSRLIIPSTVNELSIRIVDNCPAISQIVVKATVPPTCGSENLFPDTNDCPIYVPLASLEAYRSAENWSASTNRILPLVPAVPEAVDMGFPSGVKWASFNLGATIPEGEGYRYAWGEVSPWQNCPYLYGDKSALTKYNAEDQLTVLDSVDDAAAVGLGGNWRIPTYQDWDELLGCTYELTSINEVEGYLFTSKINQNSIFIPFVDKDNWGYSFYWTGTLDTYNDRYDYAWCFALAPEVEYTHGNYGSSRFSSHSVRPVYVGE